MEPQFITPGAIASEVCAPLRLMLYDAHSIFAGLIVANRLSRIIDHDATVRLIAGGAE